MAFEINDIRVKNEFRTEDVDWLLANVGDKITIEVDIESATYAIADNDNPLIQNYTQSVVGSYWLHDDRGGFKDFQIGDILEYKNYVANTIVVANIVVLDKLDDYNIRLDQDVSGAGNDQFTYNTIFSVKTPITAIKYWWNFIENSEQTNYFSKVDGSEQVAIAKEVDATDTVTVVPLEFIGDTTYQIGDISVKGGGINTVGVYGFKFTIYHNTYITPFMLASQLTDLENRIKPTYFLNQNCLKYVTKILAMYDYNDPNRVIEVESEETDGNTGWFNENFNTGKTNYFVDSITYKRPDTTIIPSIELVATETTVEIVVKNTVDTPFSNNNTKFVLNICKAAFDDDEYTKNNFTLSQNFIFDRALNTVGSASVDGDNFGTDYQVLKDVEATFVSSSEILITAKIAMDANVLALLSDLDEKRYMLWVATQNHTLETKEADKVALLADVQFYYEDASDPGLLIFDSNEYLRHYEDDKDTQGIIALDGFPEDEVVANTVFYIDKNGRETDTIQLMSAEAKIKAKNTSTGESFTLDNFKLNMSGYPYINGNQYLSFSLPRQFHIPQAEIRKNIIVNRRIDLDNAGKYYYEFLFPFLIRWEYFIAILDSSGDFFDLNEPNNGWNNDWYRYSTFANWEIQYDMIIKVKKNGILYTFTNNDTFTLNNYDSNADWNPNTIKSYKNSDNTYLFDGSNKYILGYEATRIEAEFTKVSGTPILANCHVVFGLEVYEEGGVDGRRRLSSDWTSDADTWWKSVDTTNKVKLTLIGNTIKAEALIDFNKILLNKSTYKVTARLYDTTVAAIEGKLFQDGDDLLFQDGDNYIFQDQ